MQCSLCGGPAFYRRNFEGVDLCKRCFKKSIENKVRSTISKYKMLGPEDKIAVAVSGGKDSLALLWIMRKLKSRFPSSKIFAVTIDEGIRNYRDEALSLARSLSERINIEHRVFSFKEFFKVTLDDIVQKKRETSRVTPCSYCGVLRRRALEIAARNIGANKIATAHNLDDEVQTALLNIIHGGVDRLLRSGPYLRDPQGRFIPRIKPLSEIYEREVALYAYIVGLDFQITPCPYRSEALRGEVRNIINMLEENHPGIKYTVYSSKLRLSRLLDNQIFNMQTCKSCGYPTSGEICEVCKIIGDTNSRRYVSFEKLN
ncbi:TIGR00269 family protein [Candidatus Bathyarchaeota archaeon]|nr:TIGR00269 family protein [Candidatus Bathyarchaeota archaeon]